MIDRLAVVLPLLLALAACGPTVETPTTSPLVPTVTTLIPRQTTLPPPTIPPTTSGEPPSLVVHDWPPEKIVAEQPAYLSGEASETATVMIPGATLDQGPGYWNATVPLEEGTNTIEITAVDASGQQTSTTLLIHYRPDLPREAGVITEIVEANGTYELTTDYVEWLFGEEAEAAAAEDGVALGGDGDVWYFRNQSPQLRTFEIAPEAIILMLGPNVTPYEVLLPGELWNFFASVEDPYTFYPGTNSSGYFWLTPEGSRILQIEEIYVP